MSRRIHRSRQTVSVDGTLASVAEYAILSPERMTEVRRQLLAKLGPLCSGAAGGRCASRRHVRNQERRGADGGGSHG